MKKVIDGCITSYYYDDCVVIIDFEKHRKEVWFWCPICKNYSAKYLSYGFKCFGNCCK